MWSIESTDTHFVNEGLAAARSVSLPIGSVRKTNVNGTSIVLNDEAERIKSTGSRVKQIHAELTRLTQWGVEEVSLSLVSQRRSWSNRTGHSPVGYPAHSQDVESKLLD